MDWVGLYPTWYEPGVGSGWVVGIMATIHVLASHTSVGAAILFAYLAVIAYRRNQPQLLDYIRKYGMFLLVFSYVIGSITGPGIWYSTTVASPRGISALIHSFVWVWATEWVFFVIEVVGVYLVIYLVGRVDQRTHMRIAVIFGMASYTTMLIILGILSFMMVPGKESWLADGRVLSAFYGKNTFAQLAMRTAFMFTMTAVVGGIVAARITDPAFKREISRKLAWLGIVSSITGAALFQWYIRTLPETAHLVMDNRLPSYFQPAIITVLLGILAYFVMTLISSRTLVVWGASVATLSILLFGLWPEEVARESIRKPWVAGQYIYSNQVIGRDVPGMNIKSEIPLLETHGFLKTQVFVPDNLRVVTPDNMLNVGESLALTTCSNCHSLSETGMRPLHSYFGGTTNVAEVETYLRGALSTGATLYMPMIPLKPEEAEALAVFIVNMKQPQAAIAHIQHKAALAQADKAAAMPATLTEEAR